MGSACASCGASVWAGEHRCAAPNANSFAVGADGLRVPRATCAVCGGPAGCRGHRGESVMLYQVVGGGEAWFHPATCAVRARKRAAA